MLYLVTGFPRSGTSAMMAGLRAGGLPVHYSKEREVRMVTEHPDTNPNFLELKPGEALNVDFPIGLDGKCVKVLAPWHNLGNLAVMDDGYFVILMLRDPRAIAVSMAYHHGGAIYKGDKKILDEYGKYIKKSVSLITNRRDMRVLVQVGYDDLIEDPKRVFNLIAENGCPINPAKAAAFIDPSRRRIKFDGPDDTKPFEELNHWVETCTDKILVDQDGNPIKGRRNGKEKGNQERRLPSLRSQDQQGQQRSSTVGVR